MCLLLEILHWTDNCIPVFGKLIFGSNLKVALPLPQDSLNYICLGNDIDEDKFSGVLQGVISVPTEVFQRILNMK